MKAGDIISVPALIGYKLYQERPFACRPVCKCGSCDGTTISLTAEVMEIIYWADNSVQARVLADNGSYRYVTLEAPKGDACF